MQETMDRLGMTKRDTATIALGRNAADISTLLQHPLSGRILLQKSKIEQPEKSRES